ncbi:Protein of unknown function DUF544 [Macleaya cordata]|uniref:MINDY deubiquitinase domain-containing protein n=1 Tax=Macleaya cordata TaxID=56857 RepID=A0A200PPK7_MACCD|nr:Protein of unknown function DUF544 [Macleaya cordata]
MATEDHRNELENEILYKTKVVQFFGRTTPIILQNDNGPCPLLAICNVLLLRNNLNLSVDSSDVSLSKLLSLVAERIIDSNSNVENKDAGYVENQQKNIQDALDLLPRLSTGIDVNVQFRRLIDDFEFTPERAIFDLLDIPLYHGWIVDPQDHDTANAIGSKSYNALMGELVALETNNTVKEQRSYPEEDCIDFAAATTATLGVPTPCLSRARSFDDSLHSISCHHIGRNGDVEEEAELLRSLKLSAVESPTSKMEPLSIDENVITFPSSDESTHLKNSELGVLYDSLDGPTCDEHHQPEPRAQNCNVSSSNNLEGISLDAFLLENSRSCTKVAEGDHSDQSSCKETGVLDLVTNHFRDVLFQSGEVQQVQQTCLQVTCSSGNESTLQQTGLQVTCSSDNESTRDSTSSPVPSARNADSDFFGGTKQLIDVPHGVTSSLNGSEPIYEGEERILDTGLTIYESREPIYEGEMVLAEQAERTAGDACTPQQGDLIGSFLRNNASQLTIYGLFCLQEGLKEHELCVFFRNNHFSTMFKLNGELYLLATDQGYINQPDLVWEKLNEVNGDTVFMTSDFEEFRLESHPNGAWDEQNAVASTTDYLASIDNSTAAASTLSSDLQLAIALQQQEFENQPQRQHNSQQSSAGGGSSRLVTGPQVSRSSASSNSSSKQDSKIKDKCVVM